MRFCGYCGTAAGAAGTSPPEVAAAAAPPLPPPAADAPPDREAALTAFASDRLHPHGAGMAEERRLITALFADLSGFTPLSERLDAEELLEVIDPIITALSDIVGRYGGYVEKFAGDALLALFGAPIAHEDDATRALEVSIEMHRTLGELQTTMGPNGAGLTLHIGIASGRGIARMIGSQVRMDYAVLGDSVILAQRLESATPSGETYISASTRDLVQDRFDFERVPPLTLKGKAEPVPAWRLVAAGGRATHGIGLAGRRHAPLLGRTREVARVRESLERLAGGHGGALVAVVGEAGVGKSRLVEVARALAAERGIAWLDARCLSYGASLPYWPIADVLRRELDGADPGIATAEMRAPHAGAFLATLLGAPPSADLAAMDPQAFRRGLYSTIRAWLEQRAATGGLVLAIEDVHWADASTLALLADLATSEVIGIWGTSRPPTPDWLADGNVIEVAQLDPEAIGELVDHILGGAADPILHATVVERSAGNPFFAEEIVRGLLESGGVALGPDGRFRLAPTGAEDVPATIEGVLSSRLDALDGGARATLGIAAVVGRRVDLRILESIAGAGDSLRRNLDALVSSGLLDPVDGGDPVLVFHHALIADVAYGRLLRKRRRELHQRAAEAGEALYGAGDESIDFLARHLYLGGGGPKAITYLERAAERASRMFANEEAIIHLGRAEELAAADPTQADATRRIRLARGALQELVGGYDDAEGTYRRILETGRDVRAWRGLASVHRVRGRYAEALQVLDTATAEPWPADEDLRPLWLERGWTLTSTEAMGEAITALQQGIASQPTADDALAGELFMELARAESYAGRLEAALAHAERALAIAHANGDIRAETSALRVLGLIQHDLGRLDDAAASLRRIWSSRSGSAAWRRSVVR